MIKLYEDNLLKKVHNYLIVRTAINKCHTNHNISEEKIEGRINNTEEQYVKKKI